MTTENREDLPERSRLDQPTDITRRAVLGYAAAAGAALTVAPSLAFAQDATPGIDPASKTITIGARDPAPQRQTGEQVCFAGSRT